MIITNKTEIAFNTETESELIPKFLEIYPDWTQDTLGKFLTLAHTHMSYFNAKGHEVVYACGNCTHAKTQTLSTGIEQLICEASSDWRIVHPNEGCNKFSPKY